MNKLENKISEFYKRHRKGIIYAEAIGIGELFYGAQIAVNQPQNLIRFPPQDFYDTLYIAILAIHAVAYPSIMSLLAYDKTHNMNKNDTKSAN